MVDPSPHKIIKGRGASYNPGNRFDKIELEPDGDYLDEAGDLPPVKTEFYRDTTKRVINFNDSPDIGFSASLNPYRGCEHGCIYCFARPTHEYFGLSSGLDFETKIFVKEDAAHLLEKELSKSSWEPRTSSPANRLKAVEALSKEGIPVNVMVAPVIPALNDIEIPRLIKAATEAGAHSAGYVIVRLPYANKDLFVNWLSEHYPEKKDKILNRIRAIRGGKLYDSEWHKRFRGEGIFAQQIDQIFNMAYKKYGLDQRTRPPLSTEHFRPAGGQQLTFF